MSDRVAVFNDGDPADRRARPHCTSTRERFVAHFIGENNVLAGTVEMIEQGYCRVALASGGRVARAVNVAGAGAPTSLSVRPERIAIIPDGGVQRRAEPAAGHGAEHHLPRRPRAGRAPGRRQRGVHGQAAAGRHGSLSHGRSVSISFRPKTACALDPV